MLTPPPALMFSERALMFSERRLRSILFRDVRRTRDLRRQRVEGTYYDVVDDVRELVPGGIKENSG